MSESQNAVPGGAPVQLLVPDHLIEALPTRTEGASRTTSWPPWKSAPSSRRDRGVCHYYHAVTMGAKAFQDPRPSYWENVTNLQRVKHELIRCYLGGWFAKLGYTTRRVIYFDTHAGRGEYRDGRSGSPLVALETLLGHAHRDALLRRCEFRFQFLELDADNAALLRNSVDGLKPLPQGIAVDVEAEDYEEVLEALVASMRGGGVTPSFFFVDPYTFCLPGHLLHELMSFSRVEVFVNIIWRQLDMAIQGELRKPTSTKQAENLDKIFDGSVWRKELSADVLSDFEARALRAAGLFQRMTGARWATPIRMLGKNRATKYVLLHLSNHDRGRDLMKDCLWKVCPDGEFVAHQATDWNQQVLITPEPDLAQLKRWVVEQLRQRPRRWAGLSEAIRPTLWRTTHLNEVIRSMRKDGMRRPAKRPCVIATDYEGRFSQKADPLLSLGEEHE